MFIIARRDNQRVDPRYLIFRALFPHPSLCLFFNTHSLCCLWRVGKCYLIRCLTTSSTLNWFACWTSSNWRQFDSHRYPFQISINAVWIKNSFLSSMISSHHEVSVMPRRPCCSGSWRFRQFFSHFSDINFMIGGLRLCLLWLHIRRNYRWRNCGLSWHNFRFRAHFALRYWITQFILVLQSLNAGTFFPVSTREREKKLMKAARTLTQHTSSREFVAHNPSLRDLTRNFRSMSLL